MEEKEKKTKKEKKKQKNEDLSKDKTPRTQTSFKL